MACLSFNGCLAHAHRVKMWLCHMLMMRDPCLAYAHKGVVWLCHTLMTGNQEVQPYGWLNNYIPPFVYYKKLGELRILMSVNGAL